LQGAHAAYVAALTRSPLSPETRRTYASKVRQYLAWLDTADLRGDPLSDPAARDWAVRDYRTHLAAVLKRGNATVNNALAAIDDLYIRRGLGPAKAQRFDLPPSAPRALQDKAVLRWHRAAQAAALRDRALALTPYYAGARISEVVRLDLDDVHVSARKGVLRLYGKGGKPRQMQMHPELLTIYTQWLAERRTWPGAQTCPAVFLNHRSARLSPRGASDVFNAIIERAALEDEATAHALRHTFATTLVRGGTDLVTVAEMLGHARLDHVRRYALPTDDDKRHALDLLIVDR
jgi:integrase/recombinase XerC